MRTRLHFALSVAEAVALIDFAARTWRTRSAATRAFTLRSFERFASARFTYSKNAKAAASPAPQANTRKAFACSQAKNSPHLDLVYVSVMSFTELGSTAPLKGTPEAAPAEEAQAAAKAAPESGARSALITALAPSCDVVMTLKVSVLVLVAPVVTEETRGAGSGCSARSKRRELLPAESSSSERRRRDVEVLLLKNAPPLVRLSIRSSMEAMLLPTVFTAAESL